MLRVNCTRSCSVDVSWFTLLSASAQSIGVKDWHDQLYNRLYSLLYNQLQSVDGLEMS